MTTLTVARRMDVHYDKDTNSVNVAFELPGLQKEDVSIEVHKDVLTVSGEDKASSERSEGGCVIRERRHGKFARSLSLPQGLKVSSTSEIPYTATEILTTLYTA
jgi:HSP20 family protein